MAIKYNNKVEIIIHFLKDIEQTQTEKDKIEMDDFNSSELSD